MRQRWNQKKAKMDEELAPEVEDEAVRELIRAADRLNALNRRPAAVRPSPARTIPEYIAGAFPTVQRGAGSTSSQSSRPTRPVSLSQDQGEILIFSESSLIS